MKNILFIFSIFVSLTILGKAQNAGTAGAFARLGFGARGMAMGNALSAVTTGDISTYYNPALSCFAQGRTATASFSFLSLDRYLNSLSYTQAIQPTAGISAGMINAGVKKIDGRNSDGIHTEDYSTFENQFFLAFSNQVHENLSLGVAVKLYYSKLFDQVKSTTVGFDIGIHLHLIENLSAGFVMQDIGSKYIWDTKAIYPDPLGKTTKDRFPTLRRAALAYILPESKGVIDAEFENSSVGTNIFRFGAEYSFIDEFQIRGGADRIDFSDDATGVKPSFGVTFKKQMNGWTPSISYSFTVESFAPTGMHIITLSTIL